MVLVILASSICLALDSPRNDPQSALVFVLRHLDYFWTFLFVCEAMAKSITVGFAFGEGAYLKSHWNQLDFSIVCISCLVLAAEAVPQLQPLRTLRVLRVLRSLLCDYYAITM